MILSRIPSFAGAIRWSVQALSLMFVLAACGGGGGGNAAPPQRGDLVSVTSSSTISVLEVNAVLAVLAATVDTGTLRGTYGVSINRIVYKTLTPDGRLINASGVVGYPLKFNNARSPLLSYQHPTIFEDAEAPSQAASTDAVLTVLAGTGYIVAMPDYIGYGASGSEVHTYVQAQGLAAAVVDMLRATRQLLASRNVRTNGQLFLTGYSEGGYATLAAQKEIEQNLAGEFTITASMPGAGPYDMSATAQYIVGLATNDNPQITGFVFKAYDRWHGWNRLQGTNMFQSPFNTVVDTYYDGTRGSTEIRNALDTNSADLFAATFLTDFLGSGEPTVKAGFAANNIYNWAPSRPTRLFHGADDSIVPYSNATTALSAMIAAGSNPTSVTLVSCVTILGPRGHEECVPDFLGEMFNWFNTFAADL